MAGYYMLLDCAKLGLRAGTSAKLSSEALFVRGSNRIRSDSDDRPCIVLLVLNGQHLWKGFDYE
jgi:hypothetical protein